MSRKPKFLQKYIGSNLELKMVDGFIFSTEETRAHSCVYGLEMEYYFDASPVQLRISNKALSLNYSWVSQSPKDIFNFCEKECRENLLFLQEVLEDTGSLEFVTYPSSLRGLDPQLVLLCKVYEKLNRMGFSAEHQSSGVHVNVNTLNWGDDWDERIATLTKFLHFCFENKHWLTPFSGRRGFAQKNSDLTYLLLDYLGNKSPEELYESFQRQISYILESWKAGERFFALNIGFNKPNTTLGLVEFRWFGATASYKHLKAYPEFVDALILFCRKNEASKDRTFLEFKKFVTLHSTKYVQLYQLLAYDS